MLFHIEKELVIGIDDLCARAVQKFPLECRTVTCVHMPVNHILRLIFSDQVFECGKAPMRRIIHIPVSPNRGMGQQDIKSIFQNNIPLHLLNTPLHILFRIHIFSRLIPGRTA